MKTRNGFVSNSSSSSFIIEMEKGKPLLSEYFRRHPMGISYTVSDGEDYEGFTKDDVDQFLAKMYRTGNMIPLDRYLLDYFWGELILEGENPESLDGLNVEDALKLCHDYDGCATMEEALEATLLDITEGEPEDSFYVFTVGNDAEFNNSDKLSYRDYLLSDAMRDKPSELFIYRLYRISW